MKCVLNAREINKHLNALQKLNNSKKDKYFFS
jgi:hypothetical protein